MVFLSLEIMNRPCVFLTILKEKSTSETHVCCDMLFSTFCQVLFTVKSRLNIYQCLHYMFHLDLCSHTKMILHNMVRPVPLSFSLHVPDSYGHPSLTLR